MNLFQLFKASLMEPKKQAAVRIMTIGRILRFVFAVISIMTIISFIGLASGLGDTASNVEGLLEFVKEIEWLLYPFAFIFLFVSTTIYHFVKISLFAFLGLAFLSIRKRRGEYRHLWRTTALAVTVPTFISYGLSFLDIGIWVSASTSLLTIGYLYMAVGYYPKLSPAKHTAA